MERRHCVHHCLHGIVAVAAREVPAQAERELRLDHRHVEVASRELRAALVELALPQAPGERAVHADMLLARRARGRDLPADRLRAGEARERLLHRVAVCGRARAARLGQAVDQVMAAPGFPDRLCCRVALRVSHRPNLASGGCGRQAALRHPISHRRGSPREHGVPRRGAGDRRAWGRRRSRLRCA